MTESKSEQLRYIVQVAVANGQAIDWAVTMALNVIDSGKTPSVSALRGASASSPAR